MPPIVLIAAVAENGVIGRDNRLLWRLKTDLVGFKARTLGKPVIMGRKTFESLGRPLPKRLNIVVTRDPTYRAASAAIVPSLEAGLAVAAGEAARTGTNEIIVAGGGEIYTLAMPLASELVITHVAARPEGDVFFPPIQFNDWREAVRVEHPAGPDDDHAFAVSVYRRA